MSGEVGPGESFPARITRLLPLAVLGLSAPLLVVSGDRPVYFIGYHFDSLDVVLSGLGIAFGPWLALALAEAVITPRWRRWHSLVVAALLLYLGLQVAGWKYGLEGAAQWGAAAAAAALAYPLARRLPRSDSQGLGLALVGLALPGWFFFGSNISPLVTMEFDVEPPPEIAVARPAPVFLLVFDSLPLSILMDEAGEIDGGLFPHFKALQRDSTWFRNATSQHCATRYSIPSLLSGRLPYEGQLVIGSQVPGNLLRLLAGSHDLRVAEPYSRMAPDDLPVGRRFETTRAQRLGAAGRDLKLIVPTLFKSVFSQQDLGALVQRFGIHGIAVETKLATRPRFERSSFLRDLVADIGRRGPRPPLFFSHTLLPHSPYIHTPEGPQYPLGDEHKGIVLKVVGGTRTVFLWKRDLWLVHQSFQRALLQARYTDRLLGEAMDALKAAGLYDDAVVVITADHGFAIGPDVFQRDPIYPDSPLIATGKFRATHQEIYTVPLFIKRPGGRDGGRVTDENAQLVDVLPTLAGLLGFGLTHPTVGRDLFDPAAPPPAKKTFLGWNFETVELPAELGDLRAVVRDRRGWFERAPSPGWVYRLKPQGALVGREVAGLAGGVVTGWRAAPLAPAPPGVLRGTLAGPLLEKGAVGLAFLYRGEVLAVSRSQKTGPEAASYLAFYDAAENPEVDRAAVEVALVFPVAGGGMRLGRAGK